MVRALFVLFWLMPIGWAAAPHKLLVVSVDGLDWRYLQHRDEWKLRIPTMRRLLERGSYANGVMGVWPTITWPSHTSLITGVRPDQHGILGNRRPREQGGDYYWTVDLLQAPTLWQKAHEQGRSTAAVTWPVTTGAAIDYNIPEFFHRRNGGSMDLDTAETKSTSGLVEEIAKASPSFAQQWLDDRTRALATIYLLKNKQPDLMLLHLVDLDSEEHDNGPFERHSLAILERTDELLKQMLDAMPENYVLALVSDHGFERVDHIANLPVLLKQKGIAGRVMSLGGVAIANDAATAEALRKLAADPANSIGREIPHAELVQYAPKLSAAAAAFEPAEHVMFGRDEKGSFLSPPGEKGNHGFWPTRPEYRSVFLLYGPGIQPAAEPEIQMTAIAGRLASLIGLNWP